MKRLLRDIWAVCIWITWGILLTVVASTIETLVKQQCHVVILGSPFGRFLYGNTIWLTAIASFLFAWNTPRMIRWLRGELAKDEKTKMEEDQEWMLENIDRAKELAVANECWELAARLREHGDYLRRRKKLSLLWFDIGYRPPMLTKEEILEVC